MKANFAASLAAVLLHEGGFVDDPQDPGGATNKGITQAVYDDWRVVQRLPKRSVESLNDYEVGAIYRKLYWDRCRCDELPAGVDYAVFDFAVNSGPGRAAHFLQRALAVADDGTIGPATIAAATAADVPTLLNKLCSARQAYLEQLPTFAHFGTGWTRRVAEVEAQARSMCA